MARYERALREREREASGFDNSIILQPVTAQGGLNVAADVAHRA